jgi:hypothetical protein
MNALEKDWWDEARFPERFPGGLPSDYDVNERDPGTGATQLHYAAGRSDRECLDMILQHPNTDYLIIDNHGCLPSGYARATDIRRSLIEKEVEQARAQGIDYRTFSLGPAARP